MRRLIVSGVMVLAWFGMQGVGNATCGGDGNSVTVCSSNGDTTVSAATNPGSFGGSAHVGNDGSAYVDGSDSNPAPLSGWLSVDSAGVSCGTTGYPGNSTSCP